MKTCNKIISLILIIFLLILQTSIITPIVNAETNNKIISRNAKLESTIINGWKNKQNSINIRSYNISVSKLNEIYPFILLNNPEYFYVSTTYNYKYQNGKIITINPKYITTNTSKIKDMKKKIDKQANSILKGVTKDMSAYDKCLYIHDMLAQHTSYKKVNLNESFNLYGPLVKRFGVCQGYVCAYNYLLKKVGISSYAVISTDMNHTWNKVKLGSTYYHIDVTYDDAILNSPKNIEQVSHNNFLLSDSEIEKQGHYNWISYGDKKATKKYTSNTIHKKAKNGIYYVKGNYYYIDKNYDFVKQDKKQKKAVIFKIGGEKIVNGENMSYKVTNLPKLIYHKGKFYFNDCDKVYKYTIGTKPKCETIKTISRKTITNQSFIVDISVKQNNKLYYGIKNYITGECSQGKLE